MVEAVAATQATLTLNLDGADLNINNKAYWNGDTISADFDSALDRHRGAHQRLH
ncbi:MAG: hypothetical protein V8S86_10060 [Eubacteriales bacterium]